MAHEATVTHPETLFLASAILLIATVWARGEEAIVRDPVADLKSLWPVRGAREIHDALKPGAGFSFTYDGKEVGPGTLLGWKTSTMGGQWVWITTFHRPSGLAAMRRVGAFHLADAVDCTVWFRNEGNSTLEVLEAVNAIDLTFGGELARSASVVWSGGGGADAAFPPKDFAVTRTVLDPKDPSKAQVTLSSKGGMPSTVNLPFFFVENEAKTAGLFVAIGWTGEWKVTIRADPRDGTLHIQGGMPDLRSRLAPGEMISGPRVLIGAFQGGLANGTNALRRLIRDQVAPSVGGQRLVAPILYTTWFDIGAELDEKLANTLVDAAAEVGMEVFLVDAGWYKGTPSHAYTDMAGTWPAISNSLGNWELGEETSRFPSGLKALADHVRAKGMQFGLWFEPERVGPDSVLAREQPDWVMYVPKRRWGLVDFGQQEVQDYFCRILSGTPDVGDHFMKTPGDYIRKLGIRYIRWDANHHDLPPYWATRDTPDRQGMTQIRYVEGLHRVEDHIVKNHPDVIFESCAGGGRRIDLDTLARRHTIWISDQTMDPQIVRFHLEGLNQFIPGNAQCTHFCPMRATLRQEAAFPDIAFQCGFGGAFGVAGRLHEWPQTLKVQARKHVDAFKKIRRFLSEDFYLLEPQARTLDGWSGWQFHDPKADEGFVQAFRLRSPEPARRLILKALDPKSQYQFTDVYTGEATDADGAKLVSEGLGFDLPQMSSRVLMYRKKP